jgi:hypothetical protein
MLRFVEKETQENGNGGKNERTYIDNQAMKEGKRSIYRDRAQKCNRETMIETKDSKKV